MKVVIKIGTNVLIDSNGRLNEARLVGIVKDVAELHKVGNQIALVSSGAVAAGKVLAPNLAGARQRKILAAVGQPVLMQSFFAGFRQEGLAIGQILLSLYDFSNRELYRNLVETLGDFFEAGVIPIINENDVSLSFGGNDSLAAMLAVAVKADALLLLTNQPGLLSEDPRKNHQARLISVVSRVDKEIERMCSKSASDLGQGGMISKVKAAQQAVFAGITTFIADGRQRGVISKIVRGEIVGTRFIACAAQGISEQKRWLMAAKGFGQIIVDEGAGRALRAGKSLLLPGIVMAKGAFEPGSIVEVACGGDIIAYGKVNYTDKELQSALAAKKKVGTPKTAKEVIHRDYMIILK